MAGIAITANSGVVGTTVASAQALAANQRRARLVLTNLGAAGTIYVLFGSGTASASNCHLALGPGVGWEAFGNECPPEAVQVVSTASDPDLAVAEWAN